MDGGIDVFMVCFIKVFSHTELDQNRVWSVKVISQTAVLLGDFNDDFILNLTDTETLEASAGRRPRAAEPVWPSLLKVLSTCLPAFLLQTHTTWRPAAWRSDVSLKTGSQPAWSGWFFQVILDHIKVSSCSFFSVANRVWISHSSSQQLEAEEPETRMDPTGSSNSFNPLFYWYQTEPGVSFHQTGCFCPFSWLIPLVNKTVMTVFNISINEG